MGRKQLKSTVADMKDQIDLLVAGGFHTSDEIVEYVVELFRKEAKPRLLRPIAERRTRKAVKKRQRKQASWPKTTDCDRLDVAMEELNEGGVVCRQNFSCCGTCGVAEIGDEMSAERKAGSKVRGYAFYHWQDTDAATEGRGIYLNYGGAKEGKSASLKVAREIVATVRRHGLKVRWNGSWKTRIRVKLDWKRRLPKKALA